MAVPKRRRSRSRSGKSNAHLGIKKPGGSFCPRCNALMKPHRVCPVCGYYQGREILREKG